MKKNALLGLSMAMAAGLVACSNPESSGTPSTAESKPPVDEPADIVFLSNSGADDQTFMLRYGDAIKQRFPHYTIKHIKKDKGTTLPELVVSGTKVDIVIDSIGGIVSNESVIATGLNVDLTELAKKHQIDLNRFEPSTLEAIKVMGGLFGLPIKNGGLVLYYNKDLFDKFGEAYPKDGMTWNELLTLANRMTKNEGGVQYLGLSVSLPHLMRMSPQSLPMVDSKSNKAILDEDWKRFLEKTMIEPFKSPGAQNFIAQKKRLPEAGDFTNGQAAMLVFNHGLLPKNMNWDLAALPTLPEKPGIGSQPYPDYFFVTATSTVKDASMQVIKYITSDEFQLKQAKGGVIPVVKGEQIQQAFGSEMTEVKNARAMFFNKPAAPYVRSKYDNIVTNALTESMYAVVKGESDINTAFRIAEEQANKMIEAENKK